MSLLTIKDLHIGFRGSHKAAAEQINLHIEAGKTLGLVGESGSGKSVTALSILQLLPYPAAFHKSGAVLFKGQDLMSAAPQTLQNIRGNDIAMIFQEPLSSLNPLHKIGKQISEALRLHQNMTARDAWAQAIKLLMRVGIGDAASRMGSFPHQLSGGQRQRVMIAMALANRPLLLIADEPTTALDVTIEKQILDLLKDLQKETNMAILLITHDLDVVRYIADDVAVMKDGAIVEAGQPKQILDAPQHSYTKTLLAAVPDNTPPPKKESADKTPLLQVKNMRVAFKSTAPKNKLWGAQATIKAVDDVSFVLKSGETLGIVGESGSGKTSLGRAALGLQAAQGEILWDGINIITSPAKTRRAMRRAMQIVFQDPYGALSPRMTAAQIITEGLQIYEPHLTPAQYAHRLDQIMREVELDPATKVRYPHEFSGGQRQRIALARALILNPRLLVLDEPTSALDRSVQVQIITLLRRLQNEKGLSYLFISHDLKVVRALAHNLLVLKDGKIVEGGDAQTIFRAPQHPYTKTLLDAAFIKDV